MRQTLDEIIDDLETDEIISESKESQNLMRQMDKYEKEVKARLDSTVTCYFNGPDHSQEFLKSLIPKEVDINKKQYTVKWTIEIDAPSPRAAAEMALEIQRDPGSIAMVFEVLYNDRWIKIDLQKK